MPPLRSFVPNGVTRAIIIEYDAGILRAVLEAMDLTHILGDRRVRLLIDPLDEELEEAIVSSYVPSITGDFVSVPLRGRIDADSARYQRATDLIRGTIMAISDDYSVQSFFGKRWFTNIVRNLETSDRPTPPVGPIHAAMVTAAGPSLELAYDEIVTRPRGTFLIATDTSLRALLSRGIEPDAVISIDCQHISYYHFPLACPSTSRCSSIWRRLQRWLDWRPCRTSSPPVTLWPDTSPAAIAPSRK